MRAETDWTRLRSEILERDEHRCVYCGKLLDLDTMEADHIIPRSHGRNDSPENLQTVCADCHTRGRHRKHA